jgi:phytoene dehydrogenase-like protein
MPSVTSNIVIIGSGINSLSAGALLAKAGKSVTILERADHIGGNILTDETIAPGYKVDLLSCFHPLWVTGPSHEELKDDLEAEGLKYKNTTYPTGVVTNDGSTAVLPKDQEQLTAELDKNAAGDGERLGRVLSDFQENADVVQGVMSEDLWSGQGLKYGAKLIRGNGLEGARIFIGESLESSRKFLESTLNSETNQALLAPWILHTGLGPEDAGGSVMLKTIVGSMMQAGNPVPEGGGSQLPLALTRIIEKNGGKVLRNKEVVKIATENGRATGVITTDKQEYQADEAVLANVSPNALYEKLLPDAEVPEEIKRGAERYRYGRADIQVHLCLNRPPNWVDDRLSETAIVHLCDSVDSVHGATSQADIGVLPDNPSIVVGQPGAADPTRMPEGGWVIWIQLQEVPRELQADSAGEIPINGPEWTPDVVDAYVDRVLARLEKAAPGVRDSIVAKRVIDPVELERHNPNLVSGDPYCGKVDLDQFMFWRPIKGLTKHRTPVKNCFHIGAATHPGPGLHGTSGYLVAKQLR